MTRLRDIASDGILTDAGRKVLRVPKFCTVCGAEFVGHRSAKTCSDVCRAVLQRRYEASYRVTEAGRIAKREGQRRYEASEAGRETRRRYEERHPKTRKSSAKERLIRSCNAPLALVMRSRGMTAKTLAAACGIHYQQVCRFLSLREPPVKKKSGDWTESAIKLAGALQLPPDMLFPSEYLEQVRARNRGEFDILPDELCILIAPEPPRDPEQILQDEQIRQAVSYALAGLPPREERILRMRFGIGTDEKTLDEISVTLRVTRERIRQIADKAITRLMLPSRIMGIQAAAGPQFGVRADHNGPWQVYIPTWKYRATERAAAAARAMREADVLEERRIKAKAARAKKAADRREAMRRAEETAARAARHAAAAHTAAARAEAPAPWSYARQTAERAEADARLRTEYAKAARDAPVWAEVRRFQGVGIPFQGAPTWDEAERRNPEVVRAARAVVAQREANIPIRVLLKFYGRQWLILSGNRFVENPDERMIRGAP